MIGRADEGGGNEIDVLPTAECDVGNVLFGHCGKIDIDAGDVDAFVIFEKSAIFNFDDDSIFALFDDMGHQIPVIDEHPHADL